MEEGGIRFWTCARRAAILWQAKGKTRAYHERESMIVPCSEGSNLPG
jgi:hypothetical protein